MWLVLYSTLACAAFLLFGLFKKLPEWVDDVQGYRRSLRFSSYAAVASVFIVNFLRADLTVVKLAIPVLVFVFVHSLHSDFKYRKFDRHLLNAAVVAVGICSFWIVAQVPSLLMINLIVSLLFAALILFPNPLGPSDARTLLLMTLSCVATGSPELLAKSLIVAFAGVFGFAFVKAWRARRVKAFFEKMSVPMVPFLSFGGVFVLVSTLF